MGNILMTGSGGGGAGSDDCTGTAAELLKGYTGILKGSDDEPVRGTLELTGNAQAAHVLNGETFYSNDAKTKHTGNMTVNSLLSFSVAAYSGRRVLAKWQNPNQAAGKPYSGVIINYSTSGYPGTGGTRIYKGAGNNTSSGGQSQVFLDMPNLNTTYYFTAIPYVTVNNSELLGTGINGSVRTANTENITITGTQNYTIPVGYTSLDIFCVGGGGGGDYGDERNRDRAGGGGGGGYTQTVNSISVAAGQQLSIVVGSGGLKGISSRGAAIENYPSSQTATAGGASSVSRAGTVLCSANGGNCGDSDGSGGSGGSGGGTGADALSSGWRFAGAGGSDGGNGYGAHDQYGNWYANPYYGAKGQGSTTKAWGSGTLYSGGGGGGSQESTPIQAPGGSGGGGLGGIDGYRSAQDGGVNTGSGGGGGSHNKSRSGGNGGSGIVLLRIY